MKTPKLLRPRWLALPLVLAAGGAAGFDIGPRQVVDMPPNVVVQLRGEMVDLLDTLQRAQSLSGANKYLEAADLVDSTMGRPAVMRRYARGIQPSMFMPPEMRDLSQALDRSANDWALALRGGDRARAETALARVLGTCSGCHQGFQVRRLQ
jgi:hypothetical protein